MKKEQTKEVEIGFSAGIKSIGEPLNVHSTLDNIYSVLDN